MSAPILTFSERVELIAASLEALCRPRPSLEHAALHEVERRAIERALTEYPELSGDGFWHWGEEQTFEEFAFDRSIMDCTQNADQFRRCLFFLVFFCERRKTFNRCLDSIRLVTIVDITKLEMICDRGKFVSHGIFLAAAIALNYRVERIAGTPSAFLNLELIDDDDA